MYDKRGYILYSLGVVLDGVTTRIGLKIGLEETWPIAFLGMQYFGEERWILYRTLFGLLTGFVFSYVFYIFDKKRNDGWYSHKLFLYPLAIIELGVVANNLYHIMNSIY